MRPIEEIDSKDLKNIRLIVLDVDGVLVPRGTKIKQEGKITTLETKTIALEQIGQIKQLKERGYFLNINSGRGLYMLQDMFGAVLEYTSITYENGSASWIEGDIVQHVNSFRYLRGLRRKLESEEILNNKNFIGFEPKEMIITIHCKKEISKILKTIDMHNEEIIKSTGRGLYCIWNGEAYDIGVEGMQSKEIGLRSLLGYLGLEKKNALAIGDNLNDIGLLSEAGISVSADKTRVKGDFHVPLNGKRLPAAVMMDCILRQE
jgi:HAD superfamily hydrolase (TIGR01484 family)